MTQTTETNLDLIKPYVKTELSWSKISRDIISSILDYTTIVLESNLIARHKSKHGAIPVKSSLTRLVNEGILDTGSVEEVRWYCLRRECKSHFTGEIVPNENYRKQLKEFVEICS